MRVVVLGAGTVGTDICAYLSRDDECDITLLGEGDALDGIASRFPNIDGIRGDVASPVSLAQAGVAEADVLVASTPDEKANILAGYFTNRMNRSARIICRVRSSEYQSVLARANGGFVDVLVNPEQEVARAALRLIESRDMFFRCNILDDKAQAIGLRIGDKSNILNTQLRQLTPLFEDLSALVVGVRRNRRLRIAGSDDEVYAGDQIFFTAANRDIKRSLEIFGIESARHDHVVIIGAGDVGLAIAQGLEKNSRGTRIKLIDRRKNVAEAAAEQLSKTIVYLGDGLDEEILEETGISSADAILAVTEEDRTNILALAKARTRNSRALTAAHLNDASISDLAESVGIDVTLNPQRTTVSSILPHVKRMFVERVNIIGDDEAELVEVRVSSASSMRGKLIKNASFPDGVLVGALLRDGKIRKIHPNVRLRRSDRLALFMMADGSSETTRFLHSNAFAR